jgi:hypothetical protein
VPQVTVHSTQLGAKAGMATTLVTVYTVPSGKRTIVKGIWVRNAGAAATVCDVNLALSGGPSPSFFIALAATPAAGSTVFLPVWIVLNAGDVIKAAMNAGTGDLIVAGAELTL